MNEALSTEMNFSELLNSSWGKIDIRPGDLVDSEVVDLDENWVTVHAGMKSEAMIPIREFQEGGQRLELEIGDQVRVMVEALEDGHGATRLSREKARILESWQAFQVAFDQGEPVNGHITGKVKGGFIVNLGVIRAFLPGSLVDLRPIREVAHLEGKDLSFKIIKFDQKRNNIVVSRRAVLQEQGSHERKQFMETLDVGTALKGTVKNLTDYGAFVDLGNGIDGLLHITHMSWKRIRHPSEVVSVGDEVDVKVLKVEQERSRISLGMKQLGEDPWESLKKRYEVGGQYPAKVTTVMEYGCFAELEPGVEGLVHASEMNWSNRNVDPSEVVSGGEEVTVMILDIESDRRRLSLSMKQCQHNPWKQFAASHQPGDKVKGTIRSITDFGFFISLEEGVEGLVHINDLSWDEPGEKVIRNYSRGDEIEAVILAINVDRVRITLGIKQLSNDEFNKYLQKHSKGAVVSGVVKKVDARMATVELAEGVEGIIKASEVARERVDNIRHALQEGAQVQAKIIGMDRRQHTLELSIKAHQLDEERKSLEQHRKESQSSEPVTTMGELMGNGIKTQESQQDEQALTDQEQLKPEEAQEKPNDPQEQDRS